MTDCPYFLKQHVEKAWKSILCETCNAADKRALSTADLSVILSTENRSWRDSTISTLHPRETEQPEMWTTQRPGAAVGLLLAPLALAPLQHAPAERGLAPALQMDLHCTTHLQGVVWFFRPEKNPTQQMFNASKLSVGIMCSVFLVSSPRSLE